MIRHLGRLIARNWAIIALFVLVWIVMIELWNWIALAAGLVIAVGAVGLTNHLLKIDYSAIFPRPWPAVRYLLMLIWEMGRASGAMIRLIFVAPDRETEFVYHSRLTDELALFLLANAITLTPGTIAVAREDSEISVITADPDVGSATEGIRRLERRIIRLLGEERACS